MRRLVLLAAVTSALCLWEVPVRGWELSLTGDLTWTYEWYGQTGRNGFFGTYDVDRGVSGSSNWYANFNGWFGPRMRLVSGSAASQALMSVSFYPHLRLNRAIGMTGTYKIAPHSDRYGLSYLMNSSEGIGQPMATGLWTLWSFYADTPWGTIFYGKRAMAAGCGLQFDGTTNRSEESLMLTTDYGPLRFGIGITPWQDTRDYYVWGEGVALWDFPYQYLQNFADNSRSVDYRIIAFTSFFSGPMEIGIGNIFTRFAQGPELGPVDGSGDHRAGFPRTDSEINEGWLYLKYNNGRVFLNGEIDWHHRIDRFRRSLDMTFNGRANDSTVYGSDLFAPDYVESWRYMVEAGAFTGPWKFTLLYGFLPGLDRRHGVRIDRHDSVRRSHTGNATLFAQWSMLLSATYGAGLNMEDSAKNPYMTDASILAGRIDYAIAANMNVSVSLFHARRLSQGYGWGYVRPSYSAYEDGAVGYSVKGNYGNPSPAIPDNDLGWEANLTLAWQPLENWTWSLRFGYWRPGRWFTYAFIDRGVYDWTHQSAANHWGINPGRTIDPIMGLQATLVTAF